MSDTEILFSASGVTVNPNLTIINYMKSFAASFDLTDNHITLNILNNLSLHTINNVPYLCLVLIDRIPHNDKNTDKNLIYTIMRTVKSSVLVPRIYVLEHIYK